MRKQALGELDFAEAVRAEDTISRCELCQSWFITEVSPEEQRRVDDAVAQAFTEFELSRSENHRWPWAMAVAAVVVAIGLGMVSFRTADDHDPAFAGTKQQQPIATFRFESGTASEDHLDIRVSTGEVPTDEPIHADGMESGTLKGWSKPI